MNSRGTLISHRSSGDTLASSDSVAMMPTPQPATTGTQRYREFDRFNERGVASVTDREDIPSTREMPGEAPRVARRKSRSGRSGEKDARLGPAAAMGVLQLVAGRLVGTTIPAKARDS